MKADTGSKYKVSVVIPTLGGPPLSGTVEMINAGSLVPDEILICIPIEFAPRVEILSGIENVRIVSTVCKGQVQQRIEGFKQVKNEYVVQIDDDMYVYETCIEKLVSSLVEMKENVAIAPAIVYHSTKASCYATQYVNTGMVRIIHGKDGFVPGKITRAGMVVGINALRSALRFSNVDWLPGGCVAHKTKSLVLENYYPFSGKAFYEDVLHSVYLKNRNITLLIDNTVTCGIDEIEEEPYTYQVAVNRLFSELKYRKLILRLQKRTRFFLYLDVCYNYLMLWLYLRRLKSVII